MSRRLIVSLDGPSSSGKSSVGARAAAELGYRFFDTGLLYRALTQLALERGVNIGDGPALAGLVPEIHSVLDRPLKAQDDPNGLRTAEVEASVSQVAKHAEVRAALMPVQRDMAKDRGIIMAGRDIGTVILPDADLKLYLKVSARERARRRTEERGLDSREAQELERELRRRDRVDSTRAVAPLKQPDGAFLVGKDANKLEDTVREVVNLVREHEESSGAPRTKPRPLMPMPRFLAWLSRVVMRCTTRISIEGADDLPQTGALIVTPNHLSNADPPIVAGWIAPALGRRPHFLAKEQLFKGVVGRFLVWQGAIPVKAGGSDPETYRVCKKLLDDGDALILFPEGTRNPEAVIGKPLPGAALLAMRADVPILPVGISGTDRFLPRKAKLPRFGTRITVRVGRPYTLNIDPDLPRKEQFAKANEAIMGHIAALVEERHRGEHVPAGEGWESGPPEV